MNKILVLIMTLTLLSGCGSDVDEGGCASQLVDATNHNKDDLQATANGCQQNHSNDMDIAACLDNALNQYDLNSQQIQSDFECCQNPSTCGGVEI